MNILFLSLYNIEDINVSGLYNDLLRVFYKRGHKVHIVIPSERRNKQGTVYIYEKNVEYLKVRTLNIQKTNLVEKGLSTLLIERQYISAIKKYFPDTKFDLVLYTTPPITFEKVVKFIKERDGAYAYLLLKDIFPQNAVDLGLMSPKGIIYRFFKNKEKRLYKISDTIGCMSPANVKYVLTHNPEIPSDKVEICPNSTDTSYINETEHIDKEYVCKHYDIPNNKLLLLYGGNLGKPQDIPFIIECIKKEASNKDIYFIIVGSGTEYSKLEQFIQLEKPNNVKLLSQISISDFNNLASCCDAGLIFLDHRFTIPNYPSRILGYLAAGIPILAATDDNTDIGQFIEQNGIGISCTSTSSQEFHNSIQRLKELQVTKEHIRNILKNNFDVSICYNTIIKRLHDNSRQ